MNGGIPGENLTLTCKITMTVVYGIRWIRPNGGSPQMIILCDTANKVCDPAGGINGYTATIVSPTQHDLTIYSFNTATDVGKWICRDGSTGAGQFSCIMTFKSGPDSVTISPPSPGSVPEGGSLTVTCAASCNPPCSYSWTPRNQQISPTSQLKLININRSQTGNVYTCTATNSAIPKSESKDFKLTVYCEY
ncbi:carcinoembryonic antigen-related cell adhesion molecule 8-like [Gigantopelta aegis]|uniref:carcinoembryonic antigen-related cell adhesion molecule 8-like n=1 Tax=Gigantopelta aegis TaxID=1735272 RepID=UPI001B88A48B|nr:carcinoembryonic antigen-related cell adhesion molecule 8-like [Gigantopelta aegis]